MTRIYLIILLLSDEEGDSLEFKLKGIIDFNVLDEGVVLARVRAIFMYRGWNKKLI